MERYDISVVENAVNTSSICQVNLYDKVIASCMKDYLEYRKAEEQGLLLKLPCKVGDTIYRFWYVCDTPYRIQEQTIRKLSHVVAIMEDGSFGKSVFLTREEAEKALAELVQ